MTYNLSRESPIPGNARAVLIFPNGDSYGYKIDETLDILTNIWRDVTSEEEIKKQTMARNKRHLQQTAREQGVTTGPLMNNIRTNHGMDATADDLFAEKFVMEYKVSEEMIAWIEAVKQIDREMNSPPAAVVGVMMKEYFQKSFKIANKKTSSSSAGMHYIIWKVMAVSDCPAEFLCIMISLPIVYGFAKSRWLWGSI